MLEIGPGTGYYTFEMAARLDGGQVDIFDIQQEMLDHVVSEANKRGVPTSIPRWETRSRSPTLTPASMPSC